MDSLLFYQNAVAENIIQQSVKDSERDFYADQAIENRKTARLQEIVTLIVILLSGIVAIVTYRFIRLRNRANRSELEAQDEALINMKVYTDKIIAEKNTLKLEIKDKAKNLNVLRRKIDAQNSIIEKLRQEAVASRQMMEDMSKEQDETKRDMDSMRNMFDEKMIRHQMELIDLQKEYDEKNQSQNTIMESLFRTKWSSLNRLCEEYYEKGALRKFHEMLVKDIETEVRNIGSKDGLRQIEEEVTRYLDGTLEKLRNECDRLNEKDIALCSLIFAGFSVRAICFILDITANNYYVRKKRLIQKITDSHAQHMDLFLSRL